MILLDNLALVIALKAALRLRLPAVEQLHVIARVPQNLSKNCSKKPQKPGKTAKLKKTYNSNNKPQNPRK